MLADSTPGSVLSGATIRRLLKSDPPLVGGLGDPDEQVQPNGVDLRVESLWRLEGRGQLGLTGAERVAAPRAPVTGVGDWFELEPGPYVARLVEVVALPVDVMALGRPRSSLLRNGVAVHNAVWDAGYVGRSEILVLVYNPAGFRVRRFSRIVQLVFFRLDAPTAPYAGTFQGENLVTSQ
jgi:dUTP pyrophosphatase